MGSCALIVAGVLALRDTTPQAAHHGVMRSARDRWFAVGAVALVGVLTASLFWLVTLLRGKGLDWADKFSSVAAFFLTAGAGVAARPRGRLAATATD
jgi:hypothetical protein